MLGLAITAHRRSLILRKESTQGLGLIDDARAVLGNRGHFNATTGVWRDLPGGRQIQFTGVAGPGAEHKHKGRAKDLLAIDEADQFSEAVVRFLMGWVRTTHPGQRCRTVLCFNPPSSAEGRWLLAFFGPWLDCKHPNPELPGVLRWYATLPDGREVERPTGEPFIVRNEHLGADETIKPMSRTFIPARVQDNPALMKTGYWNTLLSLPEPLRSQLAYGDMAAGMQDDIWQLIPTAWVEAAMARWTPKPPSGHRMTALGVDVAHGGAAATVITPRHGNWFGPLTSYQGAVTDRGHKAAALVLRQWCDDAIINVDAIGYGAACHEALEAGPAARFANAINVSVPSGMFDKSGKFRLTNIRTAMYWKLREALDPETGDGLMLPPDRELLADLTAPLYEVRSSGIVCEAKESISERLGRSPDKGDSLCLALWQTPRFRVERLL